MVEVRVARAKNETMLQHQRGDPHVIRRNRRALLAQLTIHRRVVVGGLLVREENRDTGSKQKTPEPALVSRAARSDGKTSAQFGEDDERYMNFFCVLEGVDDRLVAAREVHVAVRVEGDSHRQSCSSTVS